MASVSSTTSSTSKSSTSSSSSSSSSTKKTLSYEQTVYDQMKSTTKNANSIGSLVENKTALTAQSTLGKSGSTYKYTNSVDYYKFTVTTAADNVGILVKATGANNKTYTSASSVSATSTTLIAKNDVGYSNVKVLDSSGKIIADSSSSATTLQKKNYQSLRDGKMSLSKGTYYLEVDFQKGVLSSKKSEYAVQLKAGTETTKAYSTKQLAAQTLDSGYSEAPGATALAIYDASQEDSTYGVTYSSTGTLFDYSA